MFTLRNVVVLAITAGVILVVLNLFVLSVKDKSSENKNTDLQTTLKSNEQQLQTALKTCEQQLETLQNKNEQLQVALKNSEQQLQAAPKKLKIALLITATNRYIGFAKNLVASAEQYFLTNHIVEYHLWTNHKKEDTELKNNNKVHFHFQEHWGWPMSAISRFKNYLELISSEEGKKYDYFYSIDADCAFVGRVAEEVVANWVTTVHADNVYYSGEEITGPEYFEDANWTRIVQGEPSQFYRQDLDIKSGHLGPAPLNHDPNFHSYVPENYIRYFCSGFHGGKREEMVKRYEFMHKGVTEDRARGHYAVVDDETYLNAANYKFGTGRIMSIAYMYPEPPRDDWHPWLWWHEKDFLPTNRRKFRPRIMNLTKDKPALMVPM